ncbi:hypothetical protein EalM132_00137 [Exiguobacterium phage vB_EalM-132]|nr:hypothetical protein EalM132_00137 [Exiguobacterium phage vB_EalM-132]
MTTTLHETGVSVNYLQHWDMKAVLKEFIQNAVFAKDVLGDSADFDYVDGFAIIRNSPSGFTKGDLLIGESQQRNHKGSPGFYGEGQKMAMLVATRLGNECTIQTNGFNVVPVIEGSTLEQGVDVLKFSIRDTDTNEGTIVKIKCDEQDLYSAMEGFLSLNEYAEKDELSTPQSILRSPHLSGNLYVNGVLVTYDKYYWGYNLNNREIMNRDRSSVNYSEANKIIGNLLHTTTHEEKVEFFKKVLFSEYLEATFAPSAGVESDNKKWIKAFKEVFGNKVVLGDGSHLDEQARYRKYNVVANVPYIWRSYLLYIGIPTSVTILEKEPLKRTHRKPSKEASATLGWAKRLIKLYYADYGTVRIAENLIDSHGNACDGLYDRENDVTWLNANVLHSKKETFTTLLHETIHRVTGANDNTEAFTRAWEDASFAILMRGKTNE